MLVGAGTASFAAAKAIREKDPKAKVSCSHGCCGDTLVEIIQWTPSNPATLGTNQSVLIRRVASFQVGTLYFSKSGLNTGVATFQGSEFTVHPSASQISFGLVGVLVLSVGFKGELTTDLLFLWARRSCSLLYCTCFHSCITL